MGYSVSYEKLYQFCKALLIASKVPEDEADIVAFVLMDASLDGIDTHGVSRLPIYLSRLQTKRINSRPSIKVNNYGALLSIDGDNGLGQLVAYRSMEKAVEAAKEFGVSFVTVKGSNHFGAASTYCKMAAKAQMIGQVYTNTPPGIPPWGGIKPYFGTNPIAYGFPHEDNPVIIDMSTSVVARGNIIRAAKEGNPIPEGWAINREGENTTNAKEALQGAVLPVGGAKGYALALAVEVMSGIMSGSAYGNHVGWIYDEATEPVNIGHSFIVIDVSRLMPFEDYNQRMRDMIREIKGIPLIHEEHEIRIPGERRRQIHQERLKKGIPLTEELFEELNKLAEELYVQPLKVSQGRGNS